MTWYAAYDRNHKLIGTLYVVEGSVAACDLLSRRIAQLTGVKRQRLEDVDLNASPATFPLFHVLVKLEEVWSEKRILLSYVTLLNEEDPVAYPVVDPEVWWAGATFVPLGAPLMCEYCPDRRPTKRTDDAS